MTLEVYELKLKVFFLENIDSNYGLNEVANFIDEVLTKSNKFLNLHLDNKYKNYTFCAPYPIEVTRKYKKEAVYTIVIRTIDSDLAGYLLDNLAKHDNKVMKGLVCDIKKINPYLIEKIYTLTPIVLKDSNGYWKNNLTLCDFEQRLKVNLIKKYNRVMNTKIEENFELYNHIKFLNKMPIKIPYKGISLLGDKVEIYVSDNPRAQELIYMSLGTGILENNSRGLGFINYKYYKGEK